MGVDLAVCLDHCTHHTESPERQALSVENSVAWAKTCREEFDTLTDGQSDSPLLIAPIQGGQDATLRRQCAQSLMEIGFDGYAFGGWPVSDDGELVEAVALTAELVGPERLSWALGIGKPEHVVAAARMGYDLFDCVIPTRDARHHRLYCFRDGVPVGASPSFYEHLYITDKRYVRDDRPIEDGCDCLLCRRYTRAYLHHLCHVREVLAQRLATLHNLRFYTRLIEHLRHERLTHA
jgi:queuine tRNA-ribosyltransferase